ncbi:MAG: protein-L-isoaspartate(D-aspartate) O-methyltransferase [Planctomycetota bacterium]|nr:MAG: protein-L-isoaspartate(D-aspartate) O-methyltransferase [Planctomycetota bacterium]
MVDFDGQRRELIERLRARGIRDPRVLAALGRVPRHLFARPEDRLRAYEDEVLPLAPGASLSQPFVVAAMLEALELEGPEKVLDVGSGSGYTTALLCELAAEVHAVEIDPALAASSRRILREFAWPRVSVECADGWHGLPHLAPFDAILVSAACDRVPTALLDQLGPGGRLVAPVGGRDGQQLEVWRRQGDSAPSLVAVGLPVRFVPLRREAP